MRGFQCNQSGIIKGGVGAVVNSGSASGWGNPLGLLNRLRNHPNVVERRLNTGATNGSTPRLSIASGCFRSRGYRRGHYDRTAKEAVRFGTTPQLAPGRLDRGARSVLWDTNMKSHDLESMSVDKLWALHMEIGAVLTRRISAEKRQLDQRLRQLGVDALEGNARRERRPYPRVLPKYRNPDNPSETWAGRGKRPRWLTAKLRSGKKLDDFRIQASSSRKQRSARG